MRAHTTSDAQLNLTPTASLRALARVLAYMPDSKLVLANFFTHPQGCYCQLSPQYFVTNPDAAVTPSSQDGGFVML